MAFHNEKIYLRLILFMLALLQLSACSETHRTYRLPHVKTHEINLVSLDKPLMQFNNMAEIYGTGVKIRNAGIADYTGGYSLVGSNLAEKASQFISGTVNKINGSISLATAANVTSGHTRNNQPSSPSEVVLSGAIKRFEKIQRKTTTNNHDFLVNIDLFLTPSHGHDVEPITVSHSIRYRASGKTVDFHLTGDSHSWHGLAENSVGNLSPIRILIEAGVIEIIGKYLLLPYWEILPGTHIDLYVIKSLEYSFKNMTEYEKILQFQKLLFLHGFQIKLNGKLDRLTESAIRQFDKNAKDTPQPITIDIYKNMYLSLPISPKVILRRRKLAQL